MRALVIGLPERDLIAQHMAFAAANPFNDLPGVMLQHETDRDAFNRLMEQFTLELPDGFNVTYTHERQPPGLCHHISVSVDAPDKMPHPAAMDEIMKAFGMRPLLESEAIWSEEVDPGLKAVNAVQLIEPGK